MWMLLVAMLAACLGFFASGALAAHRVQQQWRAYALLANAVRRFLGETQGVRVAPLVSEWLVPPARLRELDRALAQSRRMTGAESHFPVAPAHPPAHPESPPQAGTEWRAGAIDDRLET